MNYYLKMRRKELGLTQDQVAKMAGISKNAYSCIEIGEYMPRLYVAFKISIVLDCDVRFLFDDIYHDAYVLTSDRIRNYER